MTDPNRTHVTMLVDRSASMGDPPTKRSAAEEAVNAYFLDLRKVDKPCSVLLATFDAPGWYASLADPWYKTAHHGPLGAVETFTLEPRGNTALLDAMSEAIDQTGRYLASLPEKDRPGTVIFVTQTDGEENRSRLITQEGLNEKIKRQESDFQWTFVFLGMGPDAWKMQSLFVGTQMMRNSTRSADTDKAYGATYTVAAQHTNAARMAGAAGGQSVNWASRVDAEGNVEQVDAEGNVITP